MEIRNFKTSQNLIFHIIRSQNSTPETALRELIQNAYDAEATRVDITLTATGFEVRDDGRGFANRSEIELYFETFGSAHELDYTDKFGRFRMGRCQIMAFAVTHWVSNHFEMLVDIRHRGLEYDLHENNFSQSGCKITGFWYSELAEQELSELRQHIVSTVYFFHRLPVYLNGSLVSTGIEEQVITHETNEAYFIAQERCSAAHVYNLGIYTTSLTAEGNNWDFKGYIVSKQHLQLDVSRALIAGDCSVWLGIEAFLSHHYPLYSPGDSLTSVRVQYILRQIQTAQFPLGSIQGLPLFTNPARTHHYSLQHLAQQSYTFAYPDYKPTLADRISQRGKVLVLNMADIAFVVEHRSAPECITSFLAGLQYGITLQNAASEAEKQLVAAIHKNYIPFDEVPLPLTDFGILPDQGLSPVQRCALRAVRAAQQAALRRVRTAGLAYPGPTRKIFAGDSTTADGWTDGSSYIAINQTVLGRLAHGPQQCDYVAAVLVHEWCHQDPDPATHDAEFYRRYHDLTCHPTLALLPYLARKFTEKYAAYLMESELPVPQAVAPPSSERVQQLAHRQALKKLDLIVQRRIRGYNIQAGKQSIEFRLVQLHQAIAPFRHLIKLPPASKDLLEYLDKISDRWPFILDELEMVFPLLPNPATHLISGNSQRIHSLLQAHYDAQEEHLLVTLVARSRGEPTY